VKTQEVSHKYQLVRSAILGTCHTRLCVNCVHRHNSTDSLPLSADMFSAQFSVLTLYMKLLTYTVF
jgi:hypothetical protein